MAQVSATSHLEHRTGLHVPSWLGWEQGGSEAPIWPFPLGYLIRHRPRNLRGGLPRTGMSMTITQSGSGEVTLGCFLDAEDHGSQSGARIVALPDSHVPVPTLALAAPVPIDQCQL